MPVILAGAHSVLQSHMTCAAGSAATARRRTKDCFTGLQGTQSGERQPLLENHKHAQTLSGSRVLTRSQSRLAAAALQAAPCQGVGQIGRAQCRAVPEIPDGPLVISAGWGRTGTSSLKVQAKHRQACREAPVLHLSAAEWPGVTATRSARDAWV